MVTAVAIARLFTQMSNKSHAHLNIAGLFVFTSLSDGFFPCFCVFFCFFFAFFFPDLSTVVCV